MHKTGSLLIAAATICALIVGASATRAGTPTSRQSRSSAPSPELAQPSAGPVASPRELRAVASSNAQLIVLNWRSSPDVQAYFIERSADEIAFARIGIAPGDAERYADGVGLVPSTRYVYRVRAWRGRELSEPSQVAAQTSSFRVFDAIILRNKPSLAHYGLPRITVEGNFYAPEDSLQKEPYEPRVRQVARMAARNGVLVIDIEHWPLDIRRYSKEEVAGTIRRISRIVDWARAEAPALKIGLYSGFPSAEYAIVLREDEKAMAGWRQANDFLRPLAEKMDYVFPSFYTWHDDPEGWVKFAKANITEARRYGKPVFPFIMMQYHEAMKELHSAKLPREFWELELKTLRQYADGLVIWGVSGENWSEQAPWWQATKAFVAQTQPPATAPSDVAR